MEHILSDEQIVERAITGEPDAFGEIVRRWERRIYALSYGMLGREEDARDATQETFIAAFRNLRNFRGDAKVSSWLHRIAVNQCITKQRRAKVRGETSLDAEIEMSGDVFAGPGHDSPAFAVEEGSFGERHPFVCMQQLALPAQGAVRGTEKRRLHLDRDQRLLGTLDARRLRHGVLRASNAGKSCSTSDQSTGAPRKPKIDCIGSPKTRVGRAFASCRTTWC